MSQLRLRAGGVDGVPAHAGVLSGLRNSQPSSHTIPPPIGNNLTGQLALTLGRATAKLGRQGRGAPQKVSVAGSPERWRRRMSGCSTILSSSSHVPPVAIAVTGRDIFPDNLMMMACRACAKRVRDSARFAMDLVGLAEARSAEADPQVRQDRPANWTDGLLVDSSSLSTTSPTGEGGSDPAEFGPTGPARMAGFGEARGGVAPTLAPPGRVTSNSDTAQGGE
jgi:hypothetical protein